MGIEHKIQFRVRYDEADQMGVVHHSRYLTYLEMGRVELLRAAGLPHLAQEERGEPLSLASVAIRYLAPARYDDLLELVTTVEEARGARVVFKSRLLRIDAGCAKAAGEPLSLDGRGWPEGPGEGDGRAAPVVTNSNSRTGTSPVPTKATAPGSTVVAAKPVPIAEATVVAAAVTPDGKVRRLSDRELAALGGAGE
jgi:acyl-CoA thioester hydrolase